MTLRAISTKVETISPYFHLLDVAPNVRLPDNQTNAIIVSIWVRPFLMVHNGKSLVNACLVFLLYKAV